MSSFLDNVLMYTHRAVESYVQKVTKAKKRCRDMQFGIKEMLGLK